ncbi:CDGSH iron-sulfur domain-containing protein 2-like protein [Trichoplax sp. H2]|uniref:CDGSH iron-sulfur domain-containing protein 2 homolog n=1 Tax=Trichoplax adhaerens TaxID=10228 RepID=CISD2_TRIAD|nr:hypothetical protein TRIADDRAFT_21706 [Trichoplax adhaerens]B3RML8.1 RecName: Full=CDGSH iron-sulfur domain-containing protein 2 homolog [Trichoplax adhaerens]EDV27872.1 hypothetical protein TRIADDRAFT_21706 [Trichoplax adhaerens]RDD36962.1 CDGSH iron-sulfur domain-containing protein 2-like protein [Trichoplax sp. H2]|eukprot:XP_002109706.1 hypothetical protein TRIADDRAFT_21706 [Trichoplax adhaerens]
MEAIAKLIKVQLPNYLQKLPVPSSLSGFAELSPSDAIAVVFPFAVVSWLIGYSTYKFFQPKAVELPPSPKAKDTNCVNKCIDKTCKKVVHTVDIEDVGEKLVFCRCWRSKKFPYCDGSHNNHNEQEQDNVGPLIVKGKAN